MTQPQKDSTCCPGLQGRALNAEGKAYWLEQERDALLGQRERALDALSRLLDAGANPVAGLGGELDAAIRDGDAVLADLRPEDV